MAIGHVRSAYALTILDPSAGLRVRVANSGWRGGELRWLRAGSTSTPRRRRPAGSRCSRTATSGSGNAAPTNLLSFASALGKKISLYHDVSGGDYGLGIASSRLQIYGGNASADVAIGYDNVGTFVEKLAVKPTGAIAVSGNAGAAGQVLQSNGAGAAATWVSPPPTPYNSTMEFVQTSDVTFETATAATEEAIPGLTQAFTVTANNSKALVTINVTLRAYACLACGIAAAEIYLYMNGDRINTFNRGVWEGQTETISGTQLIGSLVPGTYTLEVRGRLYGNGGLATLVSTAYGNHNSMVLQVLQP